MKTIDKTRDLSVNYGTGVQNSRYSGVTWGQWYGPPTESNLRGWNMAYQQPAIATNTVQLPYAYGIYVGKEHLSGLSGSGDTYSPVFHSRLEAANIPFTCTWKANSWQSYYFVYPYYRLQFPAVSTIADNELSCYHADDPFGTATRARAWYSMQPRFASDANLLMSIIELKDFRHIGDQLLKLMQGRQYNNVQRFLESSYSGRRYASFDPSVPVSGGWLTYNLAIIPTLKDISNIANALNETVQSAQQAFCDAGQDEQSTHYTERADPILTGSVAQYGPMFWVGTQVNKVFTATLKYKYDYTMRDTLDAWRKYWGLDGSFETFWNAIPLSFVLDYFVQIGKSLHAMERDPNVNLLQTVYGESIKTTVSRGYSTIGGTLSPSLLINGIFYTGDKVGGHFLSGYRGSIYQRQLTQPYYGPAAPKLRSPSTKQGLTMLALARCFL